MYLISGFKNWNLYDFKRFLKYSNIEIQELITLITFAYYYIHYGCRVRDSEEIEWMQHTNTLIMVTAAKIPSTNYGMENKGKKK